MKLGLMRLVVVSLLAVLILCLRCSAQTGQATVTGEITDSQGRVVPSVSVVFTNVNTGIASTTTTNGQGVYSLPALQPGIYRANLTKEGFKSVVKPDIELHTQDQVSLNFSLELGSVSETVTVSANAEHMATDNPAVGMLVTRDFVENLPLNGRSFQDLIALAPGTVSESGGSGFFSINGQRMDSNYYTVDGVASNLSPSVDANSFNSYAGPGLAGVIPAQTAFGTTQTLASVDALQEFSVQTSGYTAEYGRQPGGQVAITTRSGTNDIHGTLFDYFRNTVLDANNWFLKRDAIPQPAERQNDFGGTIGGPVYLPKLYNGRDKTFFFFSYEGLRLLAPSQSLVVSVPTVAFRQFATGVAQQLLDSDVLPNGPANGDECAASIGQTFSCTGQFISSFSNPTSLDAINLRVDHSMGSRVQLFVKYGQTPSSSGLYYNQLPSQFNTNVLNSRLITVGATARLSANIINDFRFNYSSVISSTSSTAVAVDGAVPYPKPLALPQQYAPPGAVVGEGFSFILTGIEGGYLPVPGYSLAETKQHQFQLIDSVSVVKGKHDIKLGVDYRRLHPEFNLGTYSTSGLIESISSVQNNVADQFYVDTNIAAFPTFNNLSLFAQDHWRVGQRLTLDFGLRWEFNPPPGASNGLYPVALTTGNLAAASLAPEGTPQYHTVYHDFAPRLGFAYLLNPGSPHTVVFRGGTGIFFDTGQSQGAIGYNGFPFGNYEQLTDIPLPPSASQLVPPPGNGLMPLTPPYSAVFVNDPNLVLPYTLQWNLSLDVGISAKNTLTTSYVGNGGRKLVFSTQSGEIGTPNPLNPDFQQVDLVRNAASSSYNALQISDRGYVSSGLQLVASYTWAHALDNDSQDVAYLDPIRGNSDNDLRNVFTAGINYAIPSSNAHGKFLNALTSGWAVDNRLTAESGYPLTVYQGNYTLPDGTLGGVLPDVTPDVPLYLHDVQGVLGGWRLNPASITPIPVNPDGSPTVVGSAGRNFFHGPGFWNLNAAVQRTIPIHDKLGLDIRVEAFNLFNHANPGSIDTFLGDATFGEALSVATVGAPTALYATGGPRSFQIMARLKF
jgi:hypothetical protein